jgi:hypothetical protein
MGPVLNFKAGAVVGYDQDILKPLELADDLAREGCALG